MKEAATAVVLLFAALPGRAPAQQIPPSADATVQAIWEEGMTRSRVLELAQVLDDSIGPRLTGSPGSEAASDWLIRTYRSWGVDARAERIGTWAGWRRGPTHLDLTAPRVRTLAATMLSWSPGTSAPGTSGPRMGPVVTLPASPAQLGAVRGAFVLASPPEPSCRAPESWQKWATPESLAQLQSTRDSTVAAWRAAAQALGAKSMDDLVGIVARAGAAGVLTSEWSQGWGTERIYDASAGADVPQLAVECEDYGLLWRLAQRRQGPVVRLDAQAQALGEVPITNTIAMVKGAAKPDEYVLLSAHLDSWDGASGATDNGTGTVVIMEALRILHAVLPHPTRTIMVGHWNGEEQGLIGSRAFAADHPEVLNGLQASFNHDDGTGRPDRVTMEGFVGPGAYFKTWLAHVPHALADSVVLADPGAPGRGGTDNFSLTCAGAPGFGVNSKGWDYGQYTWHTNRDTFDKLVPDDLKRNATFIAMLAYFASETPDRLPRAKAELPVDPRTGRRPDWPTCSAPQRSSGR